MKKIYIFDLYGKLAHWKKFYTNSSSLTYYFPTRTNIVGILASILELPRDSYYEDFSPENIKMAISLKSKIRKKIFVMNYLNTSDNKGYYTQIKQELLLPGSFDKDINIRYRIYLTSEDINTTKILEDIKNKIVKNDFGYGVYLGQRQFRGNIEFIGEVHPDKIIRLDECKEINSSICKENISGDLNWDNLELNYVKERIPCHFNSEREIILTKEIIGEINNNKLVVKKGKLKNCWKMKYKDRHSNYNEENISFI
jgi:CRISPR-associated protein Cas5h